MLDLSPRAKTYLARLERASSTVDRQNILDSFIVNDAPIFEPLIAFQQNYSGYQLMVGHVPVTFGLLKGDGGYPVRTGTAIIDFELSELNTSEYLFSCAWSDIPFSWTLDEYGRFYEDYHITASSFDKVVESWAILDEIENDDSYQTIMQDEQLGIIDLDKRLALEMIEEASDAYRLWFRNYSIFMTQTNGLTSIYASGDSYKIYLATKPQT